jgi:ribosomal protein S18 acetylase RimI-like enzyme
MEGRRNALRDSVADSYVATWAHVLSTIPGAWTREQDGALAAFSTVPVAMMNGVWVTGQTGDPALVESLLGAVAASGLPHCLQLRPGPADALLDLGPALGLAQCPDMPLLALSDDAGIQRAREGTSVALRRIEPEESELHCAVAADGFGLPADVLATVANPTMLALPEVKAYVAELDGTAVATAVAIHLERHVGIFNVATRSQYRRRGFGAAVTAIAVGEAFDEGAEMAWLQSSEIGRGVYGALGFRLVESWKCWAGAALVG